MLPIDQVDAASALRCLSLYLNTAQPAQQERIVNLLSHCKQRGFSRDEAAIMVGTALREGAASSAVENVSLDWLLTQLESALALGLL